MKYGLYFIFHLLKITFPKCLIYKSSSGQFFVVKNESVSRKCVNGVLLKSSSDHSLFCLPASANFSKNANLFCVIDDDEGKSIQSDKDYFDDDENQRYHDESLSFRQVFIKN